MSRTQPSIAPTTYTFRVRILGGFYAPPDAGQIWRELELTGGQTLADLGEVIRLPSASTTRTCGRSSSAASPETARLSRRRRTPPTGTGS